MSDKRNPLLYVAIVFMVVAGGYMLWFNFLQPQSSGETGVTLGSVILDQEITSVTGGSVSFSDYRGSILIIDFMAPWCPPCKDQIPVLKLVESIPGVEALTINIDPTYNMSTLEAFGVAEEITWFFGHSPPTALEYGVTAIPVVLIVDPEGVIVHRGYFTSIKDFERVLSPMLG